MRAHFRLLIPTVSILLLLAGCDNYSLLDGFDRNGGLFLDIASPTLEQGGSTALYASGGKPPYSWMLIEKNMAYIDLGNRLGGIDGATYTAGNSIGAVTVRIRDSVGNTEEEAITVLPPPPTGLTVIPAGANKLTLNWTFSNSALINQFVVYRSKEGAPFTEVTTLGNESLTFTDSGLSPNTSYTYFLQAVSLAYRSRPTAHSTGTTNL